MVIPLQLTLKNFLSYREATLDFGGLHVACICGANGAGKSSLLEAIAWGIWGESRASTEDDVIHQGAMEALVDFTFQCHRQIYRVIRSRYRDQATTLEFQVQTPSGLRSLTEKGVRATQLLILQHLKLDYDTFINSAYLRQGRADEFMLKRPSERKQILADLLKLDQYDALAERAKEQARQLKAELTVADRQFSSLTEQLQQAEGLVAQADLLQTQLQQLQQEQEQDSDRLKQLHSQRQQRQTWLQQLTLQQQQQQNLSQDCHHLQQELTEAQRQLRQLETLLREGEAIVTHYTRFQRLQAEEEVLASKFHTHQALQEERQILQQQQSEQASALKEQRRVAQTQLESLQKQQQGIQQTLTRASEIESALETLRQARMRLAELDQLQMKAMPLLQRRQEVQTQLDRAQARLAARFEELQSLRQQLEVQQQRQPQLQQAALELAEQLEHLERRRAYQQLVREKGMERRTFLERLQERQRECERELAALDHKILMLQQGVTHRELDEATGTLENARITERAAEPSADYPDRLDEFRPREGGATQLTTSTAYPPCPLCDHPLDEHHWNVVLERHSSEHQDILNQLWVIREQLTTSDREIRILRQEYRELEKELAGYGAVLERRGQLQQQLQGVLEGETQLQQVVAELAALEQSLQQSHYATELHEELRLLDHSLQQLNYDDKDHALVRGQVDRWRWAELKYAEVRQAQQRQAQLAAQQLDLERTLTDLEQQFAELSATPLQQQIQALDRQIAELGYDLEQHTSLRNSLRQGQFWQLRYQELVQARQQYPQVQQRVKELTERWTSRSRALQTMTAQMAELVQQLEQVPEPADAISTLEQQMQQRRLQLDDILGNLGRLQQQQQQLDTLHSQSSRLYSQVQTLRRQLRIYQELAQAFGKNGIQALMIENVLPQLEAEANHLLGRLSGNQLHVRFVTQRASRKANPAAKLIDTLDILISDVRGTRPYETYSGGEAFRVNFAIRLALARLLAQRSGTALQMLIIDEGFGTQDEAGCDRLIGAINAIAADFACILTVTHMPHLKEAFQTRIEVHKTEAGSQLCLAG